MKILVTGSTGFVGTNLMKYFSQNEIINLRSLNLREPLLSIESADVLVHLAGKAHDLNNSSDPQEYFTVNFEKTKELFDLYLKSSIKDFIYFSSVKAVADTVSGELKEDETPFPKTPYGKSKLKAEQYLLSKALRPGKRLFILRPCMIHGPGNKGNLNLLYHLVKKGIPYPLGSFDNKRSFLSIANLLFILEKILMDPTVPGGLYNIADDEPLSSNQLIKIIAEGIGSRERIWYFSPSAIKSIAKVGDKLKLPLNTERLNKLTGSYVVSNDKIKRVLNLERFPYSSHDGLLKTIQNFSTTN